LIRRLSQLVLSSLAFWFVAGGAAYFLQDRDADVVIFSGTAWLLCLIPGLATLAWASWSQQSTPDQLVLAGLGGAGIRMFFVGGAGMVLQGRVPYFQQGDYWTYWGWILVFYLFCQTAELVILLGGRPRPTPESTKPAAAVSAEADAPVKPM
jgi:hypothetical protein